MSRTDKPPLEDDTAEKIMNLFWEAGLSAKQAICRAYDEEQPDIKRVEPFWREIWESPDMQERKADWATSNEKVVEGVKSKTPQVLDAMMDIALGDPDDVSARERLKAQKFLSEVGGIGPKKEIEISQSSKFQDMGVEEMIEYFESIPGIEVDEAEFLGHAIDSG